MIWKTRYKYMKFFVVFLVVAGMFYSILLAQVPIHLNQDELGFALNAYSISKTGFDENNRFLPLYFWHLGVMWATPIIVYLTSLFLVFLPLSETVIRLPSVFIGLINIALIYFISKKIFDNEKLALITSLFLALTPVHFIQSRILLDNLFIVPFILGWFYLILLFMEKRKIWLIFFAAFLLGLGVHSYHAAKIMMPLYLLFTIFITLPFWTKKLILLPTIIVGFFIPLLPLISWVAQYPDTLTDQVRYTGLYDTNLSPLQGIATLMNREIIFNRLAIWLSYFDPGFLFLKGDTSLIHSTQKAGVFLLPFIILIPLGIYQMTRSKLRWFGITIIIGFLTAPCAAALVGNSFRISKALIMLPFACLIATYGMQYLFNFKNRMSSLIGFSLLVILGLQFTYFLTDYFSIYRVRSYTWFNYNISGSLEALIEQNKVDKANKIYLDNNIYFIDRYWRFFLIKHHQEILSNKTLYYNPRNIAQQVLEVNSLLNSRFDDINELQTTYSNKFKKVNTILEPDGFPSFYIYRN